MHGVVRAQIWFFVVAAGFFLWGCEGEGGSDDESADVEVTISYFDIQDSAEGVDNKVVPADIPEVPESVMLSELVSDAAEATADIGRNDAQLMGRKIENLRQPGAHQMRDLRGQIDHQLRRPFVLHRTIERGGAFGTKKRKRSVCDRQSHQESGDHQDTQKNRVSS